MTRALLLLLGVALAHWMYHLWPDAGWDRQWAQYVGRGIEGVIVLSMLIRPRPWPYPMAGVVGSFAAYLGVLEEAQTAVCGIARWGLKSTGGDLCIQWIGSDVYAIAAAIVAAAGVTVFMGRNHG